MESKMEIIGGKALRGVVEAQGAKNASLPVMAAALLLKDSTLRITRVPNLLDVNTMADLLRSLGAEIAFSNHIMEIHTPSEISWETPPDLVRKMRASSLVLGPLLARCGKAVMPLPGGCSIGSRPIDLHLKGLTKMGATIELVHGAVHAHTSGLTGCRIYLDFPSVGATENLMMAAVFARGETVLENTAREPEIYNLVEALKSMGAQVEADGTGVIRIQGVDALQSAESRIIPDRIEACTYILAGAATNGEVTVAGIIPNHIDSLLAKLEEADASLTVKESEVTIHPSPRLKGVSLKTLPYPGFPTDLQPQIMAALCLAQGTSVIQESVFQSRFLHVSELNKMGAKIDIQSNSAIITGVDRLTGADVVATDLRAGAALVIAGLAAVDSTYVYHLGHIFRGYEDMDRKLTDLGADVRVMAGDTGDGCGAEKNVRGSFPALGG
ncbi:UDP-N-acetylglucosamine 1-carboxyvinyltransferase [Aminivibrio sp.]|uniref:UDP-N-acetylglucosamine 1-carboxyvinyltransferase n=1 Tax=Aminivibrio sp. TaxID=1872489 RepID=UPI0025C2C7A5|nr:UDP-N-acetylglucosamine 1-carboxyvinyltransferase [Aminivibrio sp.]MDK2958248.1 UDP-N-acetylglucosamine 1-carboxyvinyltransferase [Synergistaceae bacterium]